MRRPGSLRSCKQVDQFPHHLALLDGQSAKRIHRHSVARVQRAGLGCLAPLSRRLLSLAKQPFRRHIKYISQCTKVLPSGNGLTVKPAMCCLRRHCIAAMLDNQISQFFRALAHLGLSQPFAQAFSKCGLLSLHPQTVGRKPSRITNY